MILRVVVSHFVVLRTFASLLVNCTNHETVVDALTRNEVFEVFLVTGEAAPVSVNVFALAGIRTVPVQFAEEKSVNDSVPFSAVPPVAVIVAESFGNQFCAEVAEVVSRTRKHSESPVPVWVSATG